MPYSEPRTIYLHKKILDAQRARKHSVHDKRSHISLFSHLFDPESVHGAAWVNCMKILKSNRMFIQTGIVVMLKGAMMEDIVYRLRKRAEIRRQIPSRKSVQEGQPDRLSDLLDEAADEIESLRRVIDERQ